MENKGKQVSVTELNISTSEQGDAVVMGGSNDLQILLEEQWSGVKERGKSKNYLLYPNS